MKKITKILGILLILGLIFAGFAGAVNADDTNEDSQTEGGSTTPIELTKLTISNIKPIVGEKPKSQVTVSGESNFSTTAQVTWEPTATIFEPKTVYTAKFTVSSGNNHTFSSTMSESDITVTDCENAEATAEVSSDGTQISISCEYPETDKLTITNVSLSGIKTPVAGYKGATTSDITVTSINNETEFKDKITVSEIKWYKGSETVTDAFQPNSSYNVDIKLTAGTNCEFSTTNSSTVSISGWANYLTGTASSSSVLDVKSSAISATAKIDKITIAGLDAPSTGTTYDSSCTITGNDYITSMTPTIKWYKLASSSTTTNTISSSDTEMSSTDVFSAGNKYAVKIVINAPTDYTFDSSSLKTANIGNKTGAVTLSDSNKTATVVCNFGTPEAGKITIVNISNIVVPVVGNSPNTSATAKGKITSSSSDIALTASTAWELDGKAVSGNFEANKKYTAVITVNTASGYEFNTATVTATVKDSNNESTQYTNANISSKTESKLVIKHTFKETNGTISAVTLKFTEPAIDETMNSTVTVSSSTPSSSISSASITWNPSGTKFAGGNTYTATITVYAKTGYTFATYPTVKLNNTSCPNSEIKLSNSNQTMTITHTYSKLATPITSVAIKMDEPVAGKKAKTTPTSITSSPSSSLQATISWSPSIPESGEFDEETEYKATITVTNTNSDYAFTSGTTATINGESATVSSTNATTMTVTYTFDKTNKKGILSLPIGDEVATIPYPKDFFSELVALFQAIFNFDNWKLFN